MHGVGNMIFLKGFNYSTLRRGYDECQYEGDAESFAWPKCEITDCLNNVCIGMSKSLCYPHGIDLGEFTKEQFDENRKKKFK